MPPHSLHLLQPLNVGCFRPLKKAYGREIEQLIRRSITHVSKTEFFPAFYAAFQKTITELNIKGGFRGAGLAPFDPEVVISKLDVQLRTPSPVEEVAQQAQAWTSITPTTVLEAGSQSKYLSDRIKRHYSSSPESLLEALHSITKVLMRKIQRTALLEAENWELRELNDILSRRRRAKNPRLQNKGRLLIQEGQGSIDQMDVDTQVVAESSRSGRIRRSVRPGIRRCSVCSKTGHNARTCQVVPEASGEEYSD
jgi:hypothetical protein